MRTSLVFALIVALLLISCAPTRQARSVERSGFLGDYSELHEGMEGEPLELHRSASYDPSEYTRVVIEPVEVWVVDTGFFAESEEELEALAAMAGEVLEKELAKSYEIVEESGPGTLRVRSAITEARRSRVLSDTFSTIYPQARVFSYGVRLTRGADIFVGRASGEVEVTDAATGEPIFRAVDRRVGQKSLRGPGRDYSEAEWDALGAKSWGDVSENLEIWSRGLREMLQQPTGE